MKSVVETVCRRLEDAEDAIDLSTYYYIVLYTVCFVIMVHRIYSLDLHVLCDVVRVYTECRRSSQWLRQFVDGWRTLKMSLICPPTII